MLLHLKLWHIKPLNYGRVCTRTLYKSYNIIIIYISRAHEGRKFGVMLAQSLQEGIFSGLSKMLTLMRKCKKKVALRFGNEKKMLYLCSAISNLTADKAFNPLNF